MSGGARYRWLAGVFTAFGPAAMAAVVIDFDGPSAPASSGQPGISSHEEAGFVIKPRGPVATVTPFRMRLNGGEVPGSVSNGSPFLQLALGDSFELFEKSGLPFTPLSIDLAEYSTLVPAPAEVLFHGFFSDGSAVSVNFGLDGIADGPGGEADFETFTFPADFSGIIRLETPTETLSIDHIVVEVIPEPGAPLLILVGFSAMILSRRKRP